MTVWPPIIGSKCCKVIRSCSYHNMNDTGVGCVERFSGKAPSLELIRAKLSKFTGGEIKCSKNDENGVASVCIHHPERKNAISGKMMLDLERVVDDLQTWHDGKAILLYGADDMFCSGGDLNFARQENNPQTGYEMAIFMTRTLSKFANLPLVSVAYISGHGALGGGAEIATYCDYRLVSSDSKTRIGFVHSKMGIVPAWGGTSRLVQILGKRKALDVILTGSLLGSAQAQELGLIDGVVDSYDVAFDWILNKVKKDASVVRAAKASVINTSQITEDVLDIERRLFAVLWGGPANQSALERNIRHK